MTGRAWNRSVLIAVFIAGIFLGMTALSAYEASGVRWGGKPPAFPVEVSVDFGLADRPAKAEKIYVERGTSPKEAVSQVLPVLSGKSCCSFKEVLAIDGVAIDPTQNRWWTCKINGSKKVSSYRSKLKKGDKVEWNYVEEAQ